MPDTMHEQSFKLIAAFTFYYLVERLLAYVVSKHLHPLEFQRTLRASHKRPVYFGILLGAFISLFSFPFCANAFWQYTPVSQDKPHAEPLSLSAEICITSRGVLWVSELNRLDLYPGYLYHHLGSIVMLLSGFHLDLLELLFLPFTTLVSEIPGDLIWILAAHQEMDPRFIDNPVWERRRKNLQAVNIWVYALMRIPSIPVIAHSAVLLIQRNESRWSSKASRAVLGWVFFVLLAYLGWVVAYLRRQTQTLYRTEARCTQERTKSSLARIGKRKHGDWEIRESISTSVH
ncbi:hypothetical protein LshimejAT787_0500290 [Lyophyllum shimeji]|uniref:TLC domain-containing protein n=1 Tax=Lyophyllum shimeji TaxID=47721 RepID=A0A9P3PMF9_LYOSH|nr:hypothetical protein LshimejAT787_0500290 [Lyophyllum shimeji]